MIQVEAIIDRDNLLELGMPCSHARKTHAILVGFNDGVVRKAIGKLAAVLYVMIQCLCNALL